MPGFVKLGATAVPADEDLTQWPPLDEVSRHIQELKALDPRNVSIDELKNRASVILKGYGHALPDIYPNQYVYRARLFAGPEKPDRVTQISYPPASLAGSDQRANRAGTTMFYCCAIPECTFFELGAEASDHVVLSKWQFGNAPRLNHIAFTPSAFDALGSRRSCPDFNKNIEGIQHPLIQHDRNALVAGFLAEAFTTKLEHGKNDYRYKSQAYNPIRSAGT